MTTGISNPSNIRIPRNTTTKCLETEIYNKPFANKRKYTHTGVPSIKAFLDKFLYYFLKRLPNIAFQNIGLAETGTQYFTNRNSTLKGTFLILATINDDLLTDNNLQTKSLRDQELERTITGKVNPSLFQGFRNMLTSIKTQRIMSDESSDISSYKNEISIELNIDTDVIERSYSLKALDNISSGIFEKLSYFDIQKATFQKNIDDLDLKLEEINSKRNKIVNKINVVNDIELYLKNTIVALTSRKEFIRAYGISNDSSTETTSEQDILEGNLLRNFLGSDKDEMEKIKLGSDIDTANSTPSSISIEMMPSLNYETNTAFQRSQVDPNKLFTAPIKRRNYISQSFHSHYPKGSSIAKLNKAHDDKITCVDFDFPFGTLASTGYLDPVVKLWDLSKRQNVGELKGHMASVNCLQMDSKYNIAITGSKDATLKVWNIDIAIEQFMNDTSNNAPFMNNKPCVYTFDSHSDEVTALSFDDDNLVSGSKDKTIRQWDLNTGKCIQLINLNTTLNSRSTRVDLPLGASSDPPLIGAIQCYDAAMATGTRDGIIRLWDLRIGKVVRTLHGHENAISTLQFDSSLLVSGSLDKTVKIWDLGSGTIIDNYVYDNTVSSLSFDDKNITVATDDATPRVISRENGKHWECDRTPDLTSTSSFVKYNEGYMVEGRNNGDINVWSI
ncbi:similar to Saccharomyces cerevisiae YJL112W MDV1 Peripheral protein of the cytosolic face of the mitochondrial outer membrane, required for mitochondrial fission [Maudiozyma saulgeensis]|uniref:Similar to Saccharomyces cerevisiae YJL112W MDV1 Peripheral protein of the cytosolic face of the mitochondrial outer membrane, required for mitochondrial fission n=1 Tax=Maudiozyma saulgeensis TaxID=1789683 RepID=A0A1X7R1B1_9SACH|nr:similar to Saccharomyces cerevisiae YJL112W MDV1 Peripheral protein of the cytosolic face of the mitochondrial outer membrane, required for mitochondrial fission [Kazachstania saulgeensis]